MSSLSLRQDPAQHGVDGALLPSLPVEHDPEPIIPERSSTYASSTRSQSTIGDNQPNTEAQSFIVMFVLRAETTGGRLAHYRVLGHSDRNASEDEIRRA